MKKHSEKDKQRRICIARSEKIRTYLKSLIYNQYLSQQIRLDAQMKLAHITRDSSKVRMKNRCILTGRVSGVHRKFRLSRICLRSLASNGLIPGIIKASW